MKFAPIIRISAFTIAVGMTAGVFIGAMAAVAGIHSGVNSVTSINFLSLKSWMTLLFVCIIEEIMFRGILSLKKPAIVGSLSFITFVGLIFFSMRYFDESQRRDLGHYLIITISLIASLFVGYLLKRTITRNIITIAATRYNIIFWLTCLCFASAHISNYADKQAGIIFYFALVLPQFLVGAILGMVRIRHGLAASIFVHFIYDAWAFSLAVSKHINSHVVVVALAGALICIYLFGLIQLRLFRETCRRLRNPRGEWVLTRGLPRNQQLQSAASVLF